MNNNNYNNGANAKEEKPLRLEVDQIPFDGLLKTKRTTTIALAKTINGMFRRALHDFEGSLLVPDNRGSFALNLYFTDKGNPTDSDSIKVLKNANARQGNSIADLVQNMNTDESSLASYDLTDEAKSILSEFIFNPKGSKIDWKKRIVEITNGVNYSGRYNIMVMVTGLDLGRILRKLYKREGGARYEYQVNELRPLGDYGVGSKNYVIDIVQLDVAKTDEVAEEIGLVPHIGQVMIIR